MVTWSTDTRELCAATTPNVDGSTSCRAALESGETQISLQVTDPEGAAAIASISVQVLETEAPTIELLSPMTDGAYYSDQLILFSAMIGDNEDAPEDLSYTWTSSQDGELPISIVPENSGELEQYLYLSEGQHAVTLAVTDTTGKTSSETVAINVEGENVVPSCDILTPVAGSGFVFGQNITFTATAIDENINNGLLNISWESSLDGVFDTIPANSNGELTVVYDGLRVGNHIVTLRVEDEVGGFCADTVSLAVGTIPSIQISSPSSGDVVSVGDSVSFLGTVSDQEDIPSDIAISWVSDIDGEFSTQGSDSNGNIAFGYGLLSAGLHNIVVTATDSDGLTSSLIQSLRVNTPPSAPTIAIEPLLPLTTDDLSVLLTENADLDGDVVSYTYEWLQNGNQSSYTGSSVPASATASNDVWMVRITPNDGYVDGQMVSASVVVINSDPVINGFGLLPTEPNQNDVLTCSATASDLDGGLPTVGFSWNNLTTGASYTSTSTTLGSASLDLSTVSVSLGDMVECVVVANDSDGGSATQSASVEIINTAPIFDVSATISPNSGVFTNTALTCAATVTDPDDGPLTPAYTWSNGNTSLAVGSSYVVSAVDTNVGDSITCTATAIDSDGEVSTSSTSVVVENTEPILSGPTLSQSTVYNDDVLTCTASVVDPDESLSIAYEWLVASVQVGSSSTLDLATTAALPTDTVECVASVTDGAGASVSGSVSVIVDNRAPSSPVLSISPSNPIEGQDDLLCNIDVHSTEPDGESVSYTYSWEQDGNSTSYSTDTIAASLTTTGEEWTCLVTPSDGVLDGIPGSVSITIAALDSDGDGVLDPDDLCEGYDDNLDGNNNGLPDDCETSFSYTYSGSIETWTVPSSVTMVSFAAYGAQGANGNGGGGGAGAIIQGTFAVTPGDSYEIMVGQHPTINYGTDGHNGNSTGGGGGTFVALNGTPIIIAGGGGGGGAVTGGQNAETGENGGNGLGGGGASGGSAGQGGSSNGGNNAGRSGGGFYSDGGVPPGDGGVYCSACSGSRAYSFLNGGAGGPQGPHHGPGGFGGGGCGGNYGGGGGGGYSGGGGGSSNGYGGGGGGSFVESGGTNTSSSVGNAGNGYLLITVLGN